MSPTPASLSVFRHRVTSAAEEMGGALQRAALSTNIKERRDYSCAVFDAAGRLLAQAAHIPVHLGALEAAVAAARGAVDGWAHGDVVVLNDPYRGGSHLPDLTTVSAVLTADSSVPQAFLATRAHHADVGGSTPGSMPLAADLFGEGIVLPPVLIARGWDPTDVLDVLLANTRTPEERAGDMRAQLAAHRVGTRRVAALAGAGDFGALCSALLDHTARLAANALERVQPGTYAFSDVLDGDGVEPGPVTIRASVAIGPQGVVVDFDGSSPQTRGGVNAPLAVTRSAVLYVCGCLLRDVPLNGGAFGKIRVRAPEGSVVNPRRPAPVAAGNVETSQRIVDVLMGALAEAAPDLIPAASQGTMNNIVFGGTADGAAFTYYETLGGGAGAGPGGPGLDAVQAHMTNTRNTPVEVLEQAVPVEVVYSRLRSGSGGAGLHTGGSGIERALRFRVPARVTLVTERRLHAPWGLRGGGSGYPGRNRLEHSDGRRQELAPKTTLDVEPGDTLIVQTPGGGGWGASGD